MHIIIKIPEFSGKKRLKYEPNMFNKHFKIFFEKYAKTVKNLHNMLL